MLEFIAKHQDKIAGTLSGFDRLVFRGHLRPIGHSRWDDELSLHKPSPPRGLRRPRAEGH